MSSRTLLSRLGTNGLKPGQKLLGALAHHDALHDGIQNLGILSGTGLSNDIKPPSERLRHRCSEPRPHGLFQDRGVRLAFPGAALRFVLGLVQGVPFLGPSPRALFQRTHQFSHVRAVIPLLLRPRLERIPLRAVALLGANPMA